MTLATRFRNGLTLSSGLIFAAVSSDWSARLRDIRMFELRLPELFRLPMPEALARLTPSQADLSAISPDRLRLVCDTAALLDRRSPLGLCLRRSLTRFHFLRRAGVPVVIQFGARFKSGQPDRDVTGHAWLTLNGRPFLEDGENYESFTVMFTHPSVDV